MDVKTYATVTDICARLAGRLADDTLDTVRVDYFAGEPDFAEATLLLTLAHEGIGITAEERDLIQPTLGDMNLSDLDDVPIIDELPPVRYRFSPTAPPGSPDPNQADALLSDLAKANSLHRAWRAPLDGAPNGPSWIYIVRISADDDELRVYSTLRSRLWVQLKLRWPIEVITEGNELPPYQATALEQAVPIWPA